MDKNTIQQKVKEVAKKFTATDYFYGNWAQVDVLLDHINSAPEDYDRPVICHILPVSGTLFPKYNARMFKDSPETIIAFLVRSELDFDGEENEDKVELMKRLAKMFIVALNRSGFFDEIDEEEIPYQVPYDTADDNVTGVIVTLRLKEVEGLHICDLSNEQENFGYTE